MSPLESGLASRRIEFVRETTIGETPADPAWELFSDEVVSTEASPEQQIGARRKVGSADVQGFEIGPEDHAYSISYHLQRWLIDGSSNAQDAAADGILRAADNEINNTHSIVDREDRSSGGVDSGGIRTYTVVKGGYPSSVRIEGDPDAESPVPVTLEYVAEKIRSYEIHQPADATVITVVSTDAGDTSQSVTVEQEDGTSETISLNGTTDATGAVSFTDIDSVSLDAETAGDVQIKDDAGTVLMTIRGSDSYDGVEGDLGVPPLGSGSHASAVGSAFEHFLGDTVERPGGTSIGEHLVGSAVVVENNLNTFGRTGTMRRRIDAGNRDVSVEATVVGESQSHDDIVEHLIRTENDIVWTFDGGSVTVTAAVLTAPGSRAVEAGDAVIQRDNTFTGQSISIA